MNSFLFLISIFLWEIMSVDRKEALNIVAGLFAWTHYTGYYCGWNLGGGVGWGGPRPG